MNDQQQIAIDFWNAGLNVKITAVPGAGKSRVLLEACKSFTNGILIILAYNHDLCEETKNKIIEEGLEDQVICMTFHGLATYCIMPTYDDTALFDAIEGVESGEITVQHVISVAGVLIDEAQDFRPSFLRLLKLVLDIKNDVQYMVVGDPNQMLYTYDIEDPANIDFLTQPHLYFASNREWRRVEFHKTHRLTPPMARFASAVFGINVVSAKEESIMRHDPVSIITMNLWKSGPVMEQLVNGLNMQKVIILVPKKKNNGPLRAAINYLSSKGKKIYLHGFDGQDVRIKNKKLCIGTWHSSKGTEQELVIVLGVNNDVESNPCFVAVTRSFQKLVVIQDEENPHINLLNALKRMDLNDLLLCQRTKNLMKCSLTPRPKYKFNIKDAVTYSLDNLRLQGTGRWVRKHQYIDNIVMNDIMCEDEKTDIVCLNNGTHEDVSDIYVYACAMAVEYERSGKVRLLEDIRTPHRIPKDKQDAAILGGHHSRFISPNIPIGTLLGNDMTDILQLYGENKKIKPHQWCELACVARCWNDFHHTIRQLRPFIWFKENKFQNGCEILRRQLPGDIQFDIRIKRLSEKYDTTMLHARVHAACDDEGIYMFVWGHEINHNHQIAATIRAALHVEKTTAFIINIQTGNVQRITVRQSNLLLKDIIQ